MGMGNVQHITIIIRLKTRNRYPTAVFYIIKRNLRRTLVVPDSKSISKHTKPHKN